MTARYPKTRMRRNRSSDFIRRLVRENELSTNDLIYPMFVVEGTGTREPVESMPGIERLSLDELAAEAKLLVEYGVPAIALFPKIEPRLKDLDGSEATNPEGLIPRAIATVKESCPGLGVITDAALDPYTSHGQDGLLDDAG